MEAVFEELAELDRACARLATERHTSTVAEAEVRGLSDYVRRRRGPQNRSPTPARIGEEPRVFIG